MSVARPTKIGVLFVASALIGGALGLGRSEPTRLTFLSVGQGDCAVFQTAGRTVLIDAGPNTRGSDAGQRIVVPDLRRMGIDAIDLVLLSHPDMDHIGGLAALLKSLPVGRVGASAAYKSDPAFVRHLSDMGCGSDRMLWLDADQQAQVGDFRIEVACPEWHEGDPDNDGSEFVKITGDRASAMFTGDASAECEERMMPGHDWSAQVLHVGHHGSRTASGEDFLREVHPQWAVISCGRNNPYGHPHRSVLDRLQGLNIQIARTDEDGDVAFDLGAGGWVRQGH